MRNLRTITIALILTLTQTVRAQNLFFEWEPCTSCTATYPTYSAAVQMNSYHITEDFGRRELGSSWHNGFDVNGESGSGERGYHIKSIADGLIKKIFSTGYKVIIIEGSNNRNYAYGHIFLDSDTKPYRLGDMVLVNLSSHNNYSAIIYDPSNATGAYCLTDAPLDGSATDALYFMNYTRADGTVIRFTSTGVNRLRNRVSQGDRIAPMGGSGGFEKGLDHVHLYNFINGASGGSDPLHDFQLADNCKNPLNFLAYTQPAVVTNTIEGVATWNGTNSTVVAGTGPFYGRISVKSRVLFHVTKDAVLNRYTSTSPVFDINSVELFIKGNKPLQVYDLLKGAHFESRIDYGGRWTAPGNVRYPSYNSPIGNVVGGDNSQTANNNRSTGVDVAQRKEDAVTSADYGDYRRTGIFGNAYSGKYDAALAYDEFYFSDYHTRIHANDNFGKGNPQLASRSDDARYHDGSYFLKIKTKTVRDLSFEMTTPREIIIDNFKPFVQKVELSIPITNTTLSKVVYSKEWIWNSSPLNQTLGEDQGIYPLYADETLDILITTSEPMRKMVMSIPTLGINNQLMTDIFPGASVLFKYRIPTNVPGAHRIILSGIDFAGNSVVDFPEEIPFRGEDGVWLNESIGMGLDKNHSFYIEPAQCNNSEGGRTNGICDITADFLITTSPADPLNINFTDNSIPSANIISRSWNFGDTGSGSNNLSSTQNPSHKFSAAGTYTVSLVVSDGATTDTNTKIITVSNTPISVSFTAAPTVGNIPLISELKGTSSLKNITGWEWLISPEGYQFVSGLNSSVASVKFTLSRTYTVQLKVTNGSAVYTSAPQSIKVGLPNAPIPQFTWSEPAYAYKTISINDNSFFSCFMNGPATSNWTITGPMGWNTSATTTTGTPYSFYPIYTGSHQVQLCVTDGCGTTLCDSKTINVKQFQNSIAPDFVASAINIKRGQTIKYTDITNDPNNKIVQRGWWLDHKPGTSWGACQRCYPPGYTGIETKKYDVPGNYEVRLMVHEDIGFAGVSKTISVNVDDNVLLLQHTENAGLNISISDDCIIRVGSSGSPVGATLMKKTSGNAWEVTGYLTTTLPSSGDVRKVAVNENTLVFKTMGGIYIYEKPATGWAPMIQTHFIPTPGNNQYGARIDVTNGIIATITETSRDGAHTYLDIYEKLAGIWPTTPTKRIAVGYGVNSFLDVKIDANIVAVRQHNDDKFFLIDRLLIFEKRQGLWVQATTLSKENYYYAEDFDVSNNTIVAVNPNVSKANTPAREAYLYVGQSSSDGTSWSQNQTATLSLEFPEPVPTPEEAFSNRVGIDGDNVLVKIGKQIVLYQKPLTGWASTTETARILKPNNQTPAWLICTVGISGNYVAVGDDQTFIYEIDPFTLCYYNDKFDQFNIGSGQIIMNRMGRVSIGGGAGPAIISSGGTGNFKAVEIVIKNGFNAKPGSTVSIKATTCEDF